MPTRDIYLKIEQIADYSPVNPDPHAPSPIQYQRDCLRTPGHEDGIIPPSEVNARRLTALVYREYLDPNYLIPKPDKLVLADINEPVYYRRVPGTVIYAQPGERLRIHVFNADIMPHSFHLHGLEYGIDSDGSWPFGTQSTDGRRSDEICPGQMWTYAFDITGEMMGAWPFHDHYRHIAQNIDRGLFGGLIVRPSGDELPPKFVLPPEVEELLRRRPPARPEPPRHGMPRGPLGRGHSGHDQGQPGRGMRRGMPPEVAARLDLLKELVHVPHHHPPLPRPPAVLHVPLFFHVMRGAGTPAFDSPDLQVGGPPHEETFGTEGEFRYHCRHHPNMQGTVRVVAGAPYSVVTVRIVYDPVINFDKFDPAIAVVRPGGTVRWEHQGSPNMTHTVTEDAGGTPSFCFNGRSFVGNTPTIVAEAGQKVRWYVFNLDLGMTWHNFHPHALRWKFANETIDVRSLGPAESFVVETEAPPVLLLPFEKGKGREHKEKDDKGKPREYRLRGDFLFHCHVEMHMMGGMAGLVRSLQTVRLTQAEADQIAAETGLPLDPGNNECPPVDLERCHTLACGKWEEVPDDPQKYMMHAALLPTTTKVLFWGYTDAPPYRNPGTGQTRLWDYLSGLYSSPAIQPANLAPAPPDPYFSNLWSAEHTFLDTPEGTLLAHGGLTSGPKQTFLFHPATLSWELVNATTDARFYSTTLTLADGRTLTLYGSASRSIEIYNPGPQTWDPRKLLPDEDTDLEDWDYQYYPWTYLLPGGLLFVAGPQRHTRRFDWTLLPTHPLAAPPPPRPLGDPAQRWATNVGDRMSPSGSQQGTSVLLPLRPPNYEPRVLIAGGVPGNVTIDGVTYDIAKTAEMIDLSQAVPEWILLKTMNYRRTELTAVLLPDGRVFVAGGVIDPVPDGGPAEIFDPDNPEAGWMLCDSMDHRRTYHSSAILLPDGSVLMGGDPEPTVHEQYFPGYYYMARPTITSAPATTNYAATFTVQTPDASAIDEVVLLRPGAVTHGFDMSQRFVGCEFVITAADTLQVTAPPNGTIAPPGYYLLFIVNAGRVPSKGVWIRLTP